MFSENFQPLPASFLAENYSPMQVGGQISSYVYGNEIPSIESFRVAIFSIDRKDKFQYKFRKEFYSLFCGNWNIKLCDLGVVTASAAELDGVLSSICEYLLSKKVIPLLIGDKQELTLSLYEAFANLERLVDISSVDAFFDLSYGGELISDKSYVSKIITSMPTHLSSYKFIGYQSYYVAQEEIDFLNDLKFKSVRLGELTSDIRETEPLLRDSDILSLDFSSVEYNSSHHSKCMPNGFNSREICSIARYAGMSPKLDCMGVFNIASNKLGIKLLAQIVWYIVEGVNFRIEECTPFGNSNYTKHVVPVGHVILEFYESMLTGRWWYRGIYKDSRGKTIDDIDIDKLKLVPCTQRVYTEAVEGKIPELLS